MILFGMREENKKMLNRESLLKKMILHFPKWMDIRKRYKTSKGGQLLNSIAKETVACGAVPAVGDKTGARAKNIFNVTLPAGSEETPSTAKYSLVLYINETGGDQTSNDSGATYTGTLKVTSSDGSNYMTGAVVTQVSP